jgi:hypothetical protein
MYLRVSIPCNRFTHKNFLYNYQGCLLDIAPFYETHCFEQQKSVWHERSSEYTMGNKNPGEEGEDRGCMFQPTLAGSRKGI